MDAAQILHYLESVSLRSIGLMTIAAGALFVFRVKSVTVRHAVWTMTVAGMLLVAAMQPAAPRVRVRVIDAPVISASPDRPLSPRMTPASRPIQWESVAVAVWGLGALVLLSRLVYGLAATSRLLRDTRAVEPGVWESDRVVVPVTAASRIVLPVEAREWTDAKRAAVLAHERAHVHRSDWAIMIMASVNRAVFWFNPLTWWLARTLAALAEQACDDAALRDVPRSVYAQALVEIAGRVRSGSGRVVWEAMMMARVPEVRTRVERILDEARELHGAFPCRRWIGVTACALPIVWLSGAMHLARVEAAPLAMVAQDVRPRQDDTERKERFQEKVTQLQTAQMRLDNIHNTLSAVRAQKVSLETQLQNTTTVLHYYQSEYERQVVNRQKLAELEVDLAAARREYTPSHPKIKEMEREILRLEFETPTEPSETRVTQLSEAIKQLNAEIQRADLAMEEQIKQIQQLNQAITNFSAPTTGPSLLKRVEPNYTEAARLAGIQGKVELAVTIGTDGIARDIQVLHSLDLGLDQKAIECVGRWRFRPAMRGGQAVTAFATVEVNFKL